MSSSSATYRISAAVGMNWRTVSAVPLMPATRRTQQASRMSMARNIGRSGRVRAGPESMWATSRSAPSMSRSPQETTFCEARRPRSRRVVGVMPARSRKVRIVASRTSPVPSVPLETARTLPTTAIPALIA